MTDIPTREVFEELATTLLRRAGADDEWAASPDCPDDWKNTHIESAAQGRQLALACTIAANVVDKKKAKVAACTSLYPGDDPDNWDFDYEVFIEALTKRGEDG